ncbi:MAG: lytic murein transglycosylase, partial [Acetobacteraceae bacterium]
QKVLDLNRHQREFTLTWAQYRARVLNPGKLAGGASAFAANRSLLVAVDRRFRVTPDVVVGIWGIESDYGAITGNFNVVQSLATLGWDSGRPSFFRSELVSALRILDHGDVGFAGMTGSYAGAMGQPQFMPDSYLRYAVDFDGSGRRDIWTSVPDVLGSIANYLARNGWRYDEVWGQPVMAPSEINPALAGRERPRSLGEWMRLGVRRADGAPFSEPLVRGALLLPDGAGGEAFMVYPNFDVIRRYNPSDFYALAVGLLGSQSV